MSLRKSKCWYSNYWLHFLKCAVPLVYIPSLLSVGKTSVGKMVHDQKALSPVEYDHIQMMIMMIMTKPAPSNGPSIHQAVVKTQKLTKTSKKFRPATSLVNLFTVVIYEFS